MTEYGAHKAMRGGLWLGLRLGERKLIRGESGKEREREENAW